MRAILASSRARDESQTVNVRRAPEEMQAHGFYSSIFLTCHKLTNALGNILTSSFGCTWIIRCSVAPWNPWIVLKIGSGIISMLVVVQYLLKNRRWFAAIKSNPYLSGWRDSNMIQIQKDILLSYHEQCAPEIVADYVLPALISPPKADLEMPGHDF